MIAAGCLGYRGVIAGRCMMDWGSRCLGGGRGVILLAPPEGQSWEQTQNGQQGIEEKVVLPGGGRSFGKQTVLHQRQRLGRELHSGLP